LKSRDPDIWLHNMLDGDSLDPEHSQLERHDAERLSLYREGLKRLEDFEEKAPDDLVARVMEALPDTPDLTWRDRLREFWPKWRFWPIPALAGALALLVIVAGLSLFWQRQGRVLIPVVFDLYAPSAKAVAIVGTFSHVKLDVVPLKGPDVVGYWVIPMKLVPGRYEYEFLINGKRFVPDDDGEALRPDGLGHKNSVLILRAGMQKFDPGYGFTSDEYVTIPEDEPAKDVPSLPDENRDQWQAILDKGVAAGVHRQELAMVLVKLATANLTPDQARIILEPLFQDLHASIHARHVLCKLQEGVLQGARLNTLKAILHTRHEALKRARDLLVRSGHVASIETAPALLDATAFGLESGMAPSALYEVLSAGKGKSPGQIAAVIEVGEILYHAGLTSDTLRLIMRDCLDKDLKSQQLRRVTQHVKGKLAQGIDPKDIRDRLWVTSPATIS